MTLDVLDVFLDDVPLVIEPFGLNGVERTDAVRRCLSRLGMAPDAYSLNHSPWGQPRLKRRAGRDVAASHLPAMSIADDGDLALCAMAYGSAIRGLGVDVVAPGRFAQIASDPRRLLRFLERILAEEERRQTASVAEPLMGAYLARLFALKEAVAKSLGTGLRLGFGMGAGHGLPPQSLRVLPSRGSAVVFADGPAAQRMRRLGAHRVAASVEEQNGYTLAIAVLLGRDSRNQPSASNVSRTL
jgi:holo-[acyl-carrier protein] synthase